jgi:hypothetical protein
MRKNFEKRKNTKFLLRFGFQKIDTQSSAPISGTHKIQNDLEILIGIKPPTSRIFLGMRNFSLSLPAKNRVAVPINDFLNVFDPEIFHIKIKKLLTFFG